MIIVKGILIFLLIVLLMFVLDYFLYPSMPVDVGIYSKPGEVNDVLICFSPGTMAGAKDNLEGIEDTLLKHGDVIGVEYGKKVFDENAVVKVASQEIAKRNQYKHKVFIGSSLGGKVSVDIINRLRLYCNQSRDLPVLILVDAPTSVDDLHSPFDKAVPFLNHFTFGPIWNMVPFLSGAVIPYPAEGYYQPGVDQQDTVKKARENEFSLFTRQMRFVAKIDIPPGSLDGVVSRVIIVRSTGDTLIRREADDTWKLAAGNTPFEVKEVYSGHAGFNQWPKN